jgi:hypothetical protein
MYKNLTKYLGETPNNKSQFVMFASLQGNVFFFFVNLVISQSGNDPHEDLAKFGCKPNLKVKLLNILFHF